MRIDVAGQEARDRLVGHRRLRHQIEVWNATAHMPTPMLTFRRSEMSPVGTSGAALQPEYQATAQAAA